jgi:hypothetical protein
MGNYLRYAFQELTLDQRDAARIHMSEKYTRWIALHARDQASTPKDAAAEPDQRHVDHP